MIGVVIRLKNLSEVAGWAAKLAQDAGGLQSRLVTLTASYALRIEREAKLATPVVTSNLRGSLNTVLRTGAHTVSATIGTNVRYGPHLEYGTGLWGPKHAKYKISPKNKKALAWANPVGKEFRITDQGAAVVGRNLFRNKRGKTTARGWDRKRVSADVVVRSVMHPGISPRPFLIPPFRRLAVLYRRDLKAIVARFNPPKG